MKAGKFGVATVDAEPCPFCGTGSSDMIVILARGGVFVSCSKCSATGPDLDSRKAQPIDAIKAWNKRLADVKNVPDFFEILKDRMGRLSER